SSAHPGSRPRPRRSGARWLRVRGEQRRGRDPFRGPGAGRRRGRGSRRPHGHPPRPRRPLCPGRARRGAEGRCHRRRRRGTVPTGQGRRHLDPRRQRPRRLPNAGRFGAFADRAESHSPGDLSGRRGGAGRPDRSDRHLTETALTSAGEWPTGFPEESNEVAMSTLAPAQPSESPTSELVTFDFRNPGKMAREQVRSLEVAHETFARRWGSVLTNTLRALVHLELVGVQQLTFEDYVRSMPNPVVLGVVDLPPLPGGALLEINVPMGLTMVDRMLGGLGRPVGVRRPTELEA